MGTRISACAGVVAGLLVVSVCRADPGWVGAPYSLAIPTSITGRGQSVSSSFDLTLSHDVAGCSVYFTAVGDAYLLKNGSGTSLNTQYRLTGATLTRQDADWVDAVDFAKISNSYGVSGTGTSTVKLWVRATEPAGATPVPAGTYSATLTVTVSWP